MRTAFIVLSCLVCLGTSQTPEFLTSPSQVVAVKGERAVIPCRIRDLGSFMVIWSNFERMLLTFDTRRIADDPRISINRPYQSEWNLHINDVTLEDAGTYSCQINTNPMMTYNVKLVVLNEVPSPVVPDEVVALSGSDVEIACKLPDLNDIGTWSYKADDKSDRSILTENEKFRLRAGQGQDSHVHTLVIKDVRAGDEGLYFCRARSGKEAETSLKVVVPPPPPALEAKAESPNKLMVRWKRPTARQANIAGYTLYVHEHGTGKEYVFDVAPNEDKAGQESFRVSDLSTKSTYTVQLATKLKMGEKISMGKRSPEVTITTPLFIPDPPGWVKVKRQSDEAAEVQWSPSESKKPGIVRGYRVTYTPLGGNKRPITSKEKTIQVEKQDGNKWKARLTGLKPKTRYQVRVAGFTRKGNGLFSKAVTYLHKTLPPEVSLNGRVLSDNSVLLTVTAIGNGRMTNVRMLYTEAHEPSWKRLDFSPEWKFTVVGGLDPSTGYFFKVKAKLGGKMKQSVTHIMTPPHDLLAPHGVEVSATASTSIEVTWDYVTTNDSSQIPLGYIVHLEETSERDGEEKRHRQSVVFNRTSVEVKDLTPGTRYNIQVGAFNEFGEGPRTDGLLFHIAESDINQAAVNEPFPPRFTNALPERLDVQSGDPLKITCVAEGFPVPEVRWYDGGEPIGVPAQGSNQLYLARVVKSTTLTCRATSQWGEIEAATIVNVAQDTTEEDKPQQDAVALGMTTTNIMPTTFTVAWKVLAGDPDSVVRFEISIADASDRVLLSQSLPGQTRSFHLRGLEPGTEYRAVIQAFGASGRESAAPLAEARASAVTLVTDGTSSAITTTRAPNVTPQQVNRYRARIDLSVMDVTPTSAVLEWDFLGLDPRYVRLFELKVKSRSNFTLMTESLKPNLNVMDLSLQPGQVYYIQVRAFDRRGEVLALNTTRVTTPTHTAPSKTEGADTDESPVLKRASLTLTTHAVAGESARLDWTLSGAQQADIGEFVLKVKDSAGRALLRQDMRPESRSLTLSNLTPNTKYFVELLAFDDKGATIATTTASFTTTSKTADESDDDSTTLRVYTEEMDTSSVKIAWDTPPKLLPDLSGVTVVLTDIANVTLLTQQMSPLTRSLTVRNLQAGERYRAHVQVKGQRRETLRSGFLQFDMEPTPGMPGRPEIINVQVANSSAVQLQWKNTPSPSPAAGSEDVTGYIINFTGVDSNNEPTQGTYQLPIFGSAQSVVIPNLRGGQRYMFQVAARNQYSFGPLSVPVTADMPRQ